MRHPASASVAWLLGLVAPTLAQSNLDEGVALGTRLAEWRAAHGESWRVHADEHTGYAEMLYGGSAAAPIVPATDAEWVDVARHYLALAQSLHGVPGGELVAERVVFLPLSQAHGSTDKMTVKFRQALGGVPVENGFVNVLMDLEGDLLSIQTTGTPFGQSLVLDPTIEADRAAGLARRDFAARAGVAATEEGPARLVVHQLVRSEQRLPVLAWTLDLMWRQPDTTPEGYTYWIDAHSGAVLDRESLVHHVDVGGTLQTMATPGTDPDKASNPEVPLPMPYARITSPSAGTTFADANGNFNFAGVTGPITITAEYRGTFNQVSNVAGAEHTVTTQLTGTGNSVMMNPASSDLITAQANAYIHVNVLRDWVRSVIPGDATADFLATSNVNINSNCNAFFDGGSINFYTAGGGCVNTAYSSVVAHELGHWLNVRYGTGNGSDGMGEGNADVFSMYLYDDPIVGRDFCGTGCFVRTGTNNRQFCGDCCGGCYGGVHADGEVWMGAAWKVRTRLNNSLGGSAGDLTADTLFLSWMNAYNQTQIKSIIETQWLTLDDDNGNIGDGTPNFGDIDGGFRQQGFPGVDLDFVIFANVTELPDTTDESGPYVVEAAIAAQINPPLASATLRYRVNGGSFQSLAMAFQGASIYRAEIPGISAPAEVDYYLTGTDSSGQSNNYPAGAPDATLGFRVGVVTTIHFTEFESGPDGWTVGDIGDDATTGIWVRANPIGTAAQPEDDHTPAPGVNCFFTGQGSPGGSIGENDVDNGKTTLKSPVFDASGTTNPRVRYWRWFSNDQGSAPNSDVFTVDISNDGGTSWTNVEVVGPNTPESKGGWFEHSFEIASIIAPTSQMRLRFVAADEGSGSIVEAALDDVEIWDLSDACPDPTPYGAGKPNSALVVPIIGFTGSNSFAANDFAVNVLTLIPNQGAVLFSGPQQASIPFAGGTLLVGGGLVREALVQLDGNGAASVPIAISLPMVGTTSYYQWWYRDPLHPDGSGIGLSNALATTFCE